MKLIISLLAWLVLSGCAPQASRQMATQSPSLDEWLQQHLTPYLADTIAHHPRLKNESFAVVRMSDGDIQPRIDGLTLALRRGITDRLAATPGVRMAWLPSSEHHHHHALQSADCGNPLRASYFIGIDSHAMPGDHWRVAVRLFDANEGTWVSGQSMAWHGRIQQQQQQASREIHEDELLRGLRMLPFTSDQADLAAAYFANNLSCLLRQRGLSESRIHVSAQSQHPAAIKTILALLDNYLSRLHQAHITDNPKQADYLLHAELHRIDGDLYQLWMALRPQHSGEHLAGLDTAAYVRLTAASAPASLVNTPTLSSKPRLTELTLLHPARPGLCDTPDPAAMGRLPIDSGEAVSSMDCFWVRAKTEHTEHLFLLFHAPDGRLARITPGRCGDPHSNGAATSSSTLYPRHGQPLRIAESAGIGTLYAVAVADSYLAERLQRHLQRLPDGCAPASADTLNAGLDSWTRQLDRLLAVRPHRLDWRALRLRFFE
jgi:hypothetical protein